MTVPQSHLGIVFSSASDDISSIILGSLKLFLSSNVEVCVTHNIKDFYHMLIMQILGVLVDSKLNMNPWYTLAAFM